MSNIEFPFEVDHYAVHLVPGTDYVATVWGKGTGADWTLPNPSVLIIDPIFGTTVAFQDDTPTGSVHPEITFRVAAEADYDMSVTDPTGGTGSYNAKITDPLGNIVPTNLYGEYVWDPLAQTMVPKQTGAQLGVAASAGPPFVLEISGQPMETGRHDDLF